METGNFKLEELPYTISNFDKRSPIFHEGDKSNCVYIVKSGCIRLLLNNKRGHRQITHFLFKGDVFGICPNVRCASAEAVTDVELKRFNMKTILEYGLQSKELSHEIIQISTIAYQQLAHHLDKVIHLPVNERVQDFYDWLNKRMNAAGFISRRPPMSQIDIADYLGIAPETLSRCIAHNRKLKKYHF